MAKCAPIRDMKDTARFSCFVEEAGEPVTVTKNGYDHLVVMTTDMYHDLSTQLAEAKLLASIAQAELDIANGQLVDGGAHIALMREKYGY